jgi:hypothetical protein
MAVELEARAYAQAAAACQQPPHSNGHSPDTTSIIAGNKLTASVAAQTRYHPQLCS